jgi:hypothetical protein
MVNLVRMNDWENPLRLLGLASKTNALPDIAL